jgi:hypothetical protein
MGNLFCQRAKFITIHSLDDGTSVRIANGFLTPLESDWLIELYKRDRPEFKETKMIVSQDDEDLGPMDDIDTNKEVTIRSAGAHFLIRYHLLSSRRAPLAFAVESGSVRIQAMDHPALIKDLKDVIAADIGCRADMIRLSRTVEDKTELHDTQSVLALCDGAHVNVRLVYRDNDPWPPK